ncbi:hypothetical protein [Chondromyces apiculatus]|uniref:Putative cell-wall-anchored protein SasA (LPXTG motif) n=1 Tax=Chondromyces apiculatus DSM 436 TaxID=1192034 RepID=A0A017TG77_9BACT|nr:hypothetical protein [Chondromyces apiculatus]EYF08303.1 putative cell-wall-anchored protein SasA (LPXTG motif) [Chondromyces apiculatus DSM 436]
MGTREGESCSGKYILIEVPNWNDAPGEADAMSSYLRLGAVKDPAIAGSAGAPRASGEDLAALVTSFADDDRVRDGCPEFVPVSERKAETERLHSKGGWRDHSDGNRVSTTRGDKVEIIRGNYRMLVLGRQNHDSGWDASGGHVQQSGITFEGDPVASSEIRYVQNYDGTWKVIENSIKGDVFTRYHGDNVEEHFGNIRQSTTGSESPGQHRENPSIVEHTWATRIESYTGSSALPVPLLKDETWAAEMESKTFADAITEETTVSGAIKSTTSASSTEDSTTVNSITSSTTADRMASTTTCPDILDTTVGNTLSTIIGTETEIIVGNVAEITVGGEEAITIGGIVDITIGLMLDVCIAGRIEYDAGPKLDLSTLKQEVAQIKTEVASIHNKTAAAINYMAAMINLG